MKMGRLLSSIILIVSILVGLVIGCGMGECRDSRSCGEISTGTYEIDEYDSEFGEIMNGQAIIEGDSLTITYERNNGNAWRIVYSRE